MKDHIMSLWGVKELERIRDGIHRMESEMPRVAREMLEKAEREFEGEHILPGTRGKPYFVGNPPKWKELPVTDKEYLWSLNRMGHWNDFITAFYITGDRKYANKLKEELLNWIQECPPPEISTDLEKARERFDQVTPWRTLEAGIRMFEVWPYTIRFLAVEGLLDDDTLKAVAVSVHQHGEMLYRIPPMLWPEADHNHYLMENLGLLYVCDLFPMFSSSPIWSVHAREQLIRCARRQLTACGAQVEGCPTYHNLCMHYFCRWMVLMNETGGEVPGDVTLLIEKGLDYSMASFRPGGGCVPWGDSDADYSPLKAAVLGYRAFRKDRWYRCLNEMIGTQKLKQELASCIFEAGEVDFQHKSDIKAEGYQKETVSLCSIQKQINQVSYRTSWKADAYHLHFGCQIPGRNGHAHIDLLSFDFSAMGRAWLVDPGRFTYDEANDRKLFKSAEMHNCLLMDGKGPYDYLSSWKFSPQRDGCILKAEERVGYFWTQGIHTCYFPIIHKRLCSVIDKRFLLIWDKVEHLEGKHLINLYFHVDAEQMYFAEGSYISKYEEGPNLCLCTLSKLSSRQLPGFVSEYIDERHPSTRICYEDEYASGSREYITLAIPFLRDVPAIEHGELFYEKGYSCMDVKVQGDKFHLAWNGDDFKLTEY